METEQVNIELYELKRVKKEDGVINIPEKTVYFQQYNHRVLYAITPIRYENTNHISCINVVKIDKQGGMRTAHIRFEDIPKIALGQTRSEEDVLKQKIVLYLINNYGDNMVSKEVFDNAFEDAIFFVKQYLKQS